MNKQNGVNDAILFQQAMAMKVGATLPLPHRPYAISKYRDGWYCTWHDPKGGDLGRVCRDDKQLADFIGGNVQGLDKFL